MTAVHVENNQTLVLEARTAKDLMTPNPISISENASCAEAAAIFTAREISAAPIINEAGRPVGILSRADLVRHERDGATPLPVRGLMTRAVLSLEASAPAWEAIAKMAAFKVHHIFVVDETDVLVGVISAFDVVRKLRLKPGDGQPSW